jgi:hypothetical protein
MKWGIQMKLLLENWREYLNEVGGLDTSWDNVHINDVFKIIGKSCNEGRKCKSMLATELEQKIKNKESLENIRKNLDPDRIKKANYSFPLIVLGDTDEYQNILDGNHRFAAALRDNAVVQVKELYNDEFDKLLGDSK